VARETRVARQREYDANMRLTQIAWEERQVPRFLALLKAQEPRPDQEDLRGFEWYFWKNQIHRGHITFKVPPGTVLIKREHITFAAPGRMAPIQGGHITYQEHTGTVLRVAFSPDGRRLALASDDRTVKVWDAVTGQEILNLQGHPDKVASVAFSPDGRRLASASEDGTVKVWDAATGQETLTLQGHTGPVTSVAFSPDGRWLAAGGRDGTKGILRLWDARPVEENQR
jgi:WD40 repeat protein